MNQKDVNWVAMHHIEHRFYYKGIKIVHPHAKVGPN